MWIFCCGMPRSASTLQFQLTSKVIEEAGLGKRIEWCEHFDFPRIRDKYTNYSGWKVFKVHIPTDEMLAELRNGNAKGVYIFRDIRDAMSSNIRKSKMDSSISLRKSSIKRWSIKWIEYYEKWVSFPETLVSKYENAIFDIPTEVRRIADHIGVSLSESECKQVAAEFTLSKQLERIESIKSNIPPEELEKGKVFVDPHSLLHSNHIQSGKIGDWKSFLTSEEIEIVHANARTWILDRGYEL